MHNILPEAEVPAGDIPVEASRVAEPRAVRRTAVRSAGHRALRGPLAAFPHRAGAAVRVGQARRILLRDCLSRRGPLEDPFGFRSGRD
jgi:hypothetical protein